MTRTLKMMIAMTAVLCLTVGCLTGPAMASGEIDLTQKGAVTLNVAEEEFQKDLGDSAVEVAVYKVASVNENGVFTLEDSFASLAENEQWNGGVLTGNTKAQDLLDAAMELIWPEPAKGEEEPAEPKIAPDGTQTVEIDGKVELDSVGLYLLLPQKVETERWVYEFSPLLLAVPSIDRTESGDPQDGEWQYELTVGLKAERAPRLTEFVIDKTLAQYNATLGPTTFLFEVEAELDGENVYSNVVSLTFSGPGTQSVTVEGVPVGAHVTVTEVYSGASYQVVGGQASVVIEELPLPEGDNVTRVPFTNDYNNYRIPDASVVNTFVYNGTGWQWQSSEEVAQ